MKALLALPQLLAAAMLQRRETPQEKSHDLYVDLVKKMLDLNNTISIPDPILGLMSDEDAIGVLGSITQPNCLQATIADVAFTNAKASRNIDGMVASLVYRALERNTPAVGQASEKCIKYSMINKEFTFQQHQDPASPGAQLNNKAVVLELARQIALVGGDPMQALESGTFAPGDVDGTVGNSCNTDNCIYSQGLLVEDASDQEIFDYVGGCVETITSTLVVSTGIGTTVTSVQGSITSGSRPALSVSATTTAQAAPPTTTTSAPQVAPTTTPPTQPANGQNLQTFQGALLGIGAPAVTANGNKFVVAGSGGATFDTLALALTRSCDIQKNQCADAANSQGGTVTVPQCDQQEDQCKNSGQR